MDSINDYHLTKIQLNAEFTDDHDIEDLKPLKRNECIELNHYQINSTYISVFDGSSF